MEIVVHLLILVAIYGILSISLNLMMGMTGLFNLGLAAFYGIGAYTSAILSRTFGVSVWLSLLAGIVMSALIDQQRARVTALARAVAIGQAKAAVVAHAHSVLVSGIDHDVLGRPHGPCKVEVAGLHAREQQGCRRLVHRVDVQQPVGARHEGAQCRGAAPFAGVGGVDALVQPLAV